MEKDVILMLVEIIGVLIIISLAVYFIFFFEADSVACINDPVGYYEYLKNTSCFCNNEIGPYRP